MPNRPAYPGRKAFFFQYDYFDQENDAHIFCLSKNTVLLAYSLISHYGFWRNRYIVDVTAERLEKVPDSEYLEIQTWVENALDELGESMANVDDLSAAIRYLADKQCCSVTGNSTDVTVTCQVPPVYGDPPIAESDPEGDEGNSDPPPNGFGTWAEFRTYKCKAANRLADDLIATVGGLSSFSGALSAIAAAAFGGVITSMLTGGILVGLMGASFGTGLVAGIVIGAIILLIAGGLGLFDYFGDLQTELLVDHAAIVCAIYNATSVSQIKSELIVFVQDALDRITFATGDDTIFEPAALDIITALLGNEAINNVFQLDSETDQYVGTIDCATCAGSGSIQFQLGVNNLPRGTGSLVPDGSERVISSTVDSNGLHYIGIKADVTENGISYLNNCDDLPAVLKNTPEENFDVIIVSTTVSTQTDAFRCAPGVHTRMWGPSTPALNVPFNISWMQAINLAAAGPFTINIKIGPAGTL